MNVDQIADDIVDGLELNFGNFSERSLAKRIIEDILSEVAASNENEIEALEAEISMMEQEKGWDDGSMYRGGR